MIQQLFFVSETNFAVELFSQNQSIGKYIRLKPAQLHGWEQNVGTKVTARERKNFCSHVTFDNFETAVLYIKKMFEILKILARTFMPKVN